jgi:hypothetical protein
MRADQDYEYKKPSGVKRIVVVGDSFTIGYEVALKETFSSVLERELNAKGLRVEVLNAGVSGFSNAEECLYIERELFKYEPDAVLLSFFNNDPDDNIRSGLFVLDGDRLVAHAEEYVPAGRLGNYLNTSVVFNWLSERSDAFVLLKERATLRLKEQLVAEQVQAFGPGEAGPAGAVATEGSAYDQRLAAAILTRLLGWTRERNIPLVIQSIPSPVGIDRTKIVDVFPYAEFDVKQPGVYFLAAKDVIQPHAGKELLYWERSHSHWTPLSHELSGKALAELIVSRQVLE